MQNLFLTADISESAALAILGASTLFIVLGAVFGVVTLAGLWKIFTKFGEPGWKALIPIYNLYVESQYIWNTKMFFIMVAAGVVYLIVDFMEIAFLAGIVSVAYAVLYIMYMHKLSKSFGHGGGFTAGLVLLPYIFLIILGFGKSEYIGNTSNGASEEESMKTL